MEAETPVRPIRKPRGFKIALCVAAVLLLLFAAFIYFLPHFLPVDYVRGLARDQVRERLGLELDFGNLGFGWNGSVVVNDVTLSAPAGKPGAGEPLLSLSEVRTNLAVGPLLSGRIVVNSLAVNGFALRLRREADGTLNLPDFSQLAAFPGGQADDASRLSGGAALLSAPASSDIPPIELRQLELNQGTLSFADASQGMKADLGIDFIKITGATLDDPFLISGLALPYPGQPEKGKFSLAGRAALIKNSAFNPAGEAVLEVDILAFAPADLAAGLGQAGLISSGALDGKLKLAYAGGKAMLGLSNFRTSGLSLSLDGKNIALPDSETGLAAEYDCELGNLVFTDLSLSSGLAKLKAEGRAGPLFSDKDGEAIISPPSGSLAFSGDIDFSGVTETLLEIAPELADSPLPQGSGRFAGSLALTEPNGNGGDSAAARTIGLKLAFSGGDLTLREPERGVALEIGLEGIELQASVGLDQAGEAGEIASTLTLKNVPVSSDLAPLGLAGRLGIGLNGGAAVTRRANGGTAAELRLENTRMQIPETPWAGALDLVSPAISLTYDPGRDELGIAALSLQTPEGMGFSLKPALISGVASGNPSGRLEAEFSAGLEQLSRLAQPLFPPEVEKLAGQARGVIRAALSEAGASLDLQAGVEAADLRLNLPEGRTQIQLPKVEASLKAATGATGAGQASLDSYFAAAGGVMAQFMNKAGDQAVEGRLGEKLQNIGEPLLAR